MVIFGDGQQTRDYVYVKDVVEALIAAATAVNINRQVINIGSGVETNLNDLVNQMEIVTGRSVNRLYNGEKSGGVPRLVADISRAQALLGFRPQTNLAAGLRLMLQEDERFRRLVG